MPDGPGRFTQNYSCSALLRIPLRPLMLRIRDCHPLRLNFPEHSPHTRGTTAWSYNPRRALKRSGFGLLPVRSPLLGESLTYFLFLQVLRCFTSLRTPRIYAVPPHNRWQVTPFRHPRINALSAAPRGLSRPHTSFIGHTCPGIHHMPHQAPSLAQHTPINPRQHYKYYHK